MSRQLTFLRVGTLYSDKGGLNTFDVVHLRAVGLQIAVNTVLISLGEM